MTRSPPRNRLLSTLKTVVGERNLLTDPGGMEPFCTGFRFGAGPALAVVRPGSLVELWRVLVACVEDDTIVVMQAANTGLTGGSTPDGDDYDRPVVVVNTMRIPDIQIIDEGRQIIGFAGSTLFGLETILEPYGREPHSVIGSSCIGASIVGGICNNSGGALVQRGPAYTEMSLFARIGEDGRIELVNELGIRLGDSPEEILRNLQEGDYEEDDVEFEKREESETDLEAEAESSPVVRYVNHIIQTALQEGASDIHIEPGEKHLKVRLRIDGILYEAMNPPKKMHAALTSRLKIMANLDIAERRLPQDGRIRATVSNRRLDLRLSTVPTANGEKTVMRILDDQAIQVSLDDLGFREDTLVLWKKQIEQPHGIILVTGPTGSGKTTTLYSSLRQMDMKRLNISTVEDPVEYNLPGVTQIQTHAMIDMTFARALKALLRQDPDVVMVGEIRDHETASIAVQAALTGHLVLSTLHTNDAPSSVTRLINIGVEPFLVGAALNGVLAQRLVRRICPACVEDTPVPEEMRDFLVVHGIDGATLPQGRGCDACRNSGYSGRLGLYELLVFDDHLRDLIASSPNVTEFRRICCERGMVSLREDGFRKVLDGRTTVEEVLRVTEATI